MRTISTLYHGKCDPLTEIGGEERNKKNKNASQCHNKCCSNWYEFSFKPILVPNAQIKRHFIRILSHRYLSVPTTNARERKQKEKYIFGFHFFGWVDLFDLFSVNRNAFSLFIIIIISENYLTGNVQCPLS